HKKTRDRGEAQSTLANLAARDDFGLEFILFTKGDPLAYADLPSRPDQRLPLEWTELAGQQHFHPALQKFLGRGIPWAHRLSSRPRTMAEEPRRKNTAVVHHQQILRAPP